MTDIFIYVIFSIIVIYDIIAVILQDLSSGRKIGIKTITKIFRKWYASRPIVPFMAGIIFIGHFGIYKYNLLFSVKTSLIIFIVLSVIFSIWNLIEYFLKTKSKLYILCCRAWWLVMAAGALAGSFWI